MLSDFYENWQWLSSLCELWILGVSWSWYSNSVNPKGLIQGDQFFENTSFTETFQKISLEVNIIVFSIQKMFQNPLTLNCELLMALYLKLLELWQNNQDPLFPIPCLTSELTGHDVTLTPFSAVLLGSPHFLLLGCTE